MNESAITTFKKDNNKIDHDFYISLVDFLNPAFLVNQDKIDSLKKASYSYFKGMILLDNIMDGDLDKSKLYDTIYLIEYSIKELSSYFNVTHSFWKDFEKLKILYFNTIEHEKKLSLVKRHISKQDFESIAKGKSAICYAIVYALNYLSNNGLRNEIYISDLLKCMKEIHIAFQYQDDINDFYKDLIRNQHTYAHVLVESELKNINEIQAHDKFKLLHKYLYVSGIAEKLIKNAINHFENAKSIAIDYKLYLLKTFLESEIKKCEAQISEINLLISKAQTKAKHKAEKLKRSTSDLNYLIKDSIYKGIDFLKNSIDENGQLTDFVTGAGIGKDWISYYSAFVLSGFKDSNHIKKIFGGSKIFSFDNDNPIGYNTSIVQDSDSLAFYLAAHYLNSKDEFSIKKLDELKKFQHNNGGWSTYNSGVELKNVLSLSEVISLDGWLSPHNCVSASICYILSLIPDSYKDFIKTARYLEKQIEPDGRVSSYWWSSPIYATSWTIIAFCQNENLKSKCYPCVDWLIRNQSENGSWIDSFSMKESFFYSALALRALSEYNYEENKTYILKGLKFILNNQLIDGSWISGRILAIPATDVKDQKNVDSWRNSSFGVNILVDDYKKVFTTVTVCSMLLRIKSL